MYFISGVAETNRAPFDVAEGESEIVAGFHVEYSGMAFARVLPGRVRQHDPGRHADRASCSSAAGLSPLDSAVFNAIPGFFWLLGKVLCVLFLFLWFRATFPRYRYDQIMRLGWKVFIPLTLVWLVLIGAWMQTPFSIWK